MTVQELIKKLQEMPKTAEVIGWKPGNHMKMSNVWLNSDKSAVMIEMNVTDEVFLRVVS